ncbi:hypothetical protein CRP01_33125 [Flavilitoribacter nigricans DSM 23189 = NBRC 102662]|uniref:Uncharacterized protein n=1 Tax=Flavilitoribacter nigricans (strain ATCC 23147 / DSM 23189 / NBRC 102662 / NCIMB 1420 / SS-2) TaxID=1122177 RepID=A0A2D0N169_FLAN2|nr:hypothetical protein CRP01_33125 [Flavilitoribacter nigricans DSM 23189 = NBRC 102662]
MKTEAGDPPARRKRPWWVYAIRWLLATALVLAVKVYLFGGWPMSVEYQFKVLDAPGPAAEGTVCDLFRELEAEASSLLQKPGEHVFFQQDSVLENGVKTSMMIKSYGFEEATQDTDAEAQSERPARPSVDDIDLDELIHFEAMTHGQARLIFADGNCEIYNLGAVLRLLREKDECHLFQAIPFEGKNYEYFNILYTESFEKINCEEGTFFRARLNISKARCPSVHSLLNCGTDFFSKHIYSKLRKRLEYMDPNNSYAYRREYELFPCKCYDGE